MKSTFHISQAVSDWLIEEEHPSIAYRALVEIHRREPDDALVKRMKAHIPKSQDVKRAFQAMQPDGSWRIGKRNSRLEVATMMDYLAELALDATDARVDLAVEYVFSHQKDDGDFNRHYSCLNGLILRALNLLGYRDDARTQKLKRLLLSSGRHDGGFHCDIRPKGRKDRPHHKSCIKGSLKTLLAFTEMPDVWKEEPCKAVVAYFLRRHVCFRSGDLGELVVPEMAKTSFPFTYRPGLLEGLYALSGMGYGGCPELAEAWALLDQHRTAAGQYVLCAGSTLPALRAGPKGKPNKWITLYGYLALKRKDDGPTTTSGRI